MDIGVLLSVLSFDWKNDTKDSLLQNAYNEAAGILAPYIAHRYRLTGYDESESIVGSIERGRLVEYVHTINSNHATSIVSVLLAARDSLEERGISWNDVLTTKGVRHLMVNDADAFRLAEAFNCISGLGDYTTFFDADNELFYLREDVYQAVFLNADDYVLLVVNLQDAEEDYPL